MRTRDQLPAGAVFVGCYVVPCDGRPLGDYADGCRHGLCQAAENVAGYAVECQEERRAIYVWAVPLTAREQALIDEGLARWCEAAREDRSMYSRYGAPPRAEV